MPLSQLQYLNNNHDWKIMISSSELFAYIPKKVEKWDEEDVKKWFQLNGISINCDFLLEKRGFDGAALLKATPQFLCFKCGLNKVLMMKVIQWIQYQRQEFEELVSEALQQSQQQEIKRSIEPTYRNSRMNIKQIQKQQEPAGLAIDIKDFATEKNKENSIRNNQKSIQAHSDAIQPLLSIKKWKKKEPIQRIQKSQKKSQKAIEGTSKDRQQASLSRADLSGVKIAQSHYEILQKILVFEHQGVISTLGNSGKIGRNVTNDVIFIEDSISRQHALILKQSGEYFIMDNQSKYGTFIQVGYGNRKTVTEGDIIAIQDEEFQITKYKFSKTTQTFDLKIRKIRDIQDKNDELFFSKKKQVTIGTDKAEIAYSPQLISPNHAKLTCDRNGVLNIVQLGGKCFRKLKKDQLFKLDDGYQRIRLGFALITTKLKSDYKPFQMISAFQVPEQN